MDSLVTIVLPTYNRAAFLPQAFASISGQTFTEWELIVVDDGSTDNTRELVAEFSANIRQPVKYIHQDNQGAYGARNTGLDHANGKYIAFFDSDDEWLPHHLCDCIAALNSNTDVDWVYGACRIVDNSTGRVIAPSTFYVDGVPRPFLNLRARKSGRLRIIDDDSALTCMITHGLFNGLQNSVIRARVFDSGRFEASSRNEAEDQLIVIRYLSRRRALGYFDAVHVNYHVHESNSSAAAKEASLDKRLRVQQAVAGGFERLLSEVTLSKSERRALRRRLSQEYFWLLGYSVLWENGRHNEAIRMFRRGLCFWPWDFRFWKTYTLACIRSRTTNSRTKRLAKES